MLPPRRGARRQRSPKIREEVILVAEKVAKVGIKKERGYLYFVDKQGDISRAKMARGGQSRSKSRRRR